MPGPNLNEYHITFSDEFNTFKLYDGKTGWTPHEKWGHRFFDNNEELQIYTDPKYKGYFTQPLGLNPFSVNNGILSIKAEPLSHAKLPAGAEQWTQLTENSRAEYTSGMISTAQTFSQKYGYFEMRAQLPEGAGLWPQFWLMPSDGSWPPEIDIFEVIGHLPSHIHQTLHIPGKPYQSHIELDKINTADGFHTYGLLWDQNKITWYVDGDATFVQPNVYNKPMYLIANLAIKEFPNGGPDQIKEWPAEMKIDYIRIYEHGPASTGGAGGTGGTGGSTGSLPATLPVSGKAGAFKYGTDRADVLFGSDKNDQIDGGRGRDTMTGGKGDDTYIVSNRYDKVIEKATEGVDTVILWATKFRLPDHVENLVISTKVGAQVWDNGSNNLMTAGAGADTFNIVKANGHDIIKGFKVGQDHIHLDNTVPVDQVKGYVANGNLVLDLPGDHSITLFGVNQASAMEHLFA